MIDEIFYNKVKKILDEEGEVSDAIQRLMDGEKYNGMSYASRERYVLEIGNNYREAKERYYKEKEEEHRKFIEEEYRKIEEEKRRAEQAQKDLEEAQRFEKQKRKEEARRKREARKNNLEIEVNDEFVDIIQSLEHQNIGDFSTEIERLEQERIAKITNGDIEELDELVVEKIRQYQDVTMDSLFSVFDSLIFLDTETTGLDSKNDKLIEIAAIKVVLENGRLKIARDFDYFIKLPDGMFLSEQITDLTGITNEDLLEKGESSEFVAKQFVSLYKGERSLLVAYNAQFDLSFIYWLLVNENLSDSLKEVKMLDALTIYKDRKPYPHKLANAIQTYDLSDIVANTHRAIDDTMSLFEVVKAMCYECDDLDKYINLFGYHPKYGINGAKIRSVTYLPQPYNSWKKLYEE